LSVAFTKEGDAESAAADLPDRPISSHPNLVTASGLAAIEAALAAARQAYAAAQAGGGVEGDRTAMARATRELRYWSSRRGSAQLVPPPEDDEVVRFGAVVTLLRDDGPRQTFRIVGEDEADPAQGAVFYLSPIARALMGKGPGDTAAFGGSTAEILAISSAGEQP